MIYYDLKSSKYIYQYDSLKFVFSSNLNLNKFKNKLDLTLNERTSKLNYFYKTKGNYDLLILYYLYKKIEHRGCLIYYNDKELDELKFKVILDV